MFVELVDREGRVVSRSEVAVGAFPLTVRLEGDGSIIPKVDRGEKHTGMAPAPVACPVLWGRLRSPTGVLLVSITTVAVFATSLYFRTYTNANSANIVGAALLIFAGLLVWAGVWALGGRIARNPARFRDQLVWTCLTTLALMVGREVGVFGRFLLPASRAVSVTASAVVLALCVKTLYGHVTIASHMPARRRWVIVAGVVAVAGAIAGLGAYATADKFNTDLDYTAILEPLNARYVPGESVEDFTAGIGKLRADVDAAARK